jgi:hypothetical protein
MPHAKSSGGYANHCPHALRLGIEGRMPEEVPDKTGRLVGPDCQGNQRIVWVTPGFVRETEIAGEKRWAIQLTQERKNVLFIFHSLPPNIFSDLPESNPPTAQQATLILGNILVQNNHVRAGSLVFGGK